MASFTINSTEPDDFARAIHEELHSTFGGLQAKLMVHDDDFKAHYELSRVVSVALLTELYHNQENGTLSENDLKDKCKRIKAKFTDYPKKNPRDLLKTLLTGRALDDDEGEEELVEKAEGPFRKAVKSGRFSASPAIKKAGVRRSENKVTPGSTKRKYTWKDTDAKNKKRVHERKDKFDEIKSKFMAKLLPLSQDSGEELAVPSVRINKEELKEESEAQDNQVNEGVGADPDTDANKSEIEEGDDKANELFVGRGSMSVNPSKPATGRQLAVLVNKSFSELMERTQPSKSREMSDYRVVLRKGLEKIKGGEALAPGEEVLLREELRI